MEVDDENDMVENFGIKPMHQPCVHADRIYFFNTTGEIIVMKLFYHFLACIHSFFKLKPGLSVLPICNRHFKETQMSLKNRNLNWRFEPEQKNRYDIKKISKQCSGTNHEFSLDIRPNLKVATWIKMKNWTYIGNKPHEQLFILQKREKVHTLFDLTRDKILETTHYDTGVLRFAFENLLTGYMPKTIIEKICPIVKTVFKLEFCKYISHFGWPVPFRLKSCNCDDIQCCHTQHAHMAKAIGYGFIIEPIM